MKPSLKRNKIPEIRNQRQHRHAGLLNRTLHRQNLIGDAAFPSAILVAANHPATDPDSINLAKPKTLHRTELLSPSTQRERQKTEARFDFRWKQILSARKSKVAGKHPRDHPDCPPYSIYTWASLAFLPAMLAFRTHPRE